MLDWDAELEYILWEGRVEKCGGIFSSWPRIGPGALRLPVSVS